MNNEGHQGIFLIDIYYFISDLIASNVIDCLHVVGTMASVLENCKELCETSFFFQAANRLFD